MTAGSLDPLVANDAYVAGGGDSPVPAAGGRAQLVIGLAAKKSVAENRVVQTSEIG